jgi:hypothetical protein
VLPVAWIGRGAGLCRRRRAVGGLSLVSVHLLPRFAPGAASTYARLPLAFSCK